MIARTEIDKCFSTALNGHGAFNFDNEERTELSPELARSALDFTIGVKKCYDDMGREIPSLRHLQDNEGNFIPCHGVTDAFHPIQHVDVFDYIVNDVMPKVPELELEMAGTIRGRSTGVFAAKFGDTFSIKGDNSEHNLRLFFSNPNNGTGSLIMGFTHVRVICQNTLRAAINEAKHDGFRVHHTAGGQLVAEGILNTISEQAQAAIEMKARCEAKKDAQCGILNFPLKRADFMAGFFYRIHRKLEENPIRNDCDQVAAESKKAKELFDRYKEGNEVNETKPRMVNNMESRILGFDSAEKVSLNRPCGNGMPSAGAIGKQGIIGLRI